MTKDEIKYHINQLTEDEKKLLVLKVKEAIETNRKTLNSSSSKKIVAYVKADTSLNTDNLKTFLKDKLPDYMVPSSIYVLEDMPLLPNGKINKKALSKFKNEKVNEGETYSGIVLPKNDIETKLVSIWEDILGFFPISTTDNFFEIGGDSILSIQIVAKARKAGIHLKANQLFESQTIAELALFSKFTNEITVEKSSDELKGYIPLTPVQHWFFETHKNAPHFWNQAVEITNANNVSSTTLVAITNQLVITHEALRLCFTNSDGIWSSAIKQSNEISAFYKLNLKESKNIDAQNKEIDDVLLDIQENTKLEEGNLFKILLFDCNGLQSNRIIIISHHLVIDMVSWHIVINEIIKAIKNASKSFITDTNINKTATIKDWSDYLMGMVSNNKLTYELNFWESQLLKSVDFPRDFTINIEEYLESSVFTIISKLDDVYTKNLVHEANAPYGSKTEDLLIAALVTTICEWSNNEQILLGIERQGRNAEELDKDVSNTVGWFTSFFPIAFSYNKQQDIGSHIKNIKEKLRAIPNNGLGFGVLKYLYSSKSSKLNKLQPKIVFNYLGKTNKMKNEDETSFEYLEYPTRDANSERNYEIEINAQIINDNLIMKLSFTKDLYKDDTAQKITDTFFQNILDLIDFCLKQDDVSYTPSDFSEVDLNQDDLDNLLSQF